MPAEKVVTLAGALDAQFCEVVNLTIAVNQLTPEEGKALSILVAGTIAGRAEFAVATDENALTIFETGKSIGLQMAEVMNGAQSGARH